MYDFLYIEKFSFTSLRHASEYAYIQRFVCGNDSNSLRCHKIPRCKKYYVEYI